MVCLYQFNLKVDGFLLVPVNLIDFLPNSWKPIVDLKLLESITQIDGKILGEKSHLPAGMIPKKFKMDSLFFFIFKVI